MSIPVRSSPTYEYSNKDCLSNRHLALSNKKVLFVKPDLNLIPCTLNRTLSTRWRETKETRSIKPFCYSKEICHDAQKDDFDLLMHKDIGTLYLIFALIFRFNRYSFFCINTIRIISGPGVQYIADNQLYNSIITAHAICNDFFYGYASY